MEPSASTTSGPMSSAAPTVINGQAGNSGSGNNGSVANDGSGGGGGPASAAANQVLDRKRLQELVKEVDAHEQLDEDVEELLLHIADDFIEQTVTQAAQLAKHRRAPTVDARDVQVVLGKTCRTTDTHHGKKVFGT